MKKTRKNFAFDSTIVKQAEKVAKKNRKSLTKHLEDLMFNDNKNNDLCKK